MAKAPSAAQPSLWDERSACIQREELPVAGLVDLDKVEARRRGDFLLSMLQRAAPPTPPPPPPRTRGPMEAAGPPSSWPHATSGLQASSLRLHLACVGTPDGARFEGADLNVQLFCGLWPRHHLEPSAAPFVPQAGHSAQIQMAAVGGVGQTEEEDNSAQQISALRCAAFHTFGQGAAVARRGADEGFAVMVSRSAWAPEDLPSACEAFKQALWPLLGSEVVALEVEGRPGVQAPARLVMRCLSYVWVPGFAGDMEHCWDFDRYRSCPRGPRCRWSHAVPRGYRDFSIQILPSA